jgi:hypothetical protein
MVSRVQATAYDARDASDQLAHPVSPKASTQVLKPAVREVREAVVPSCEEIRMPRHDEGVTADSPSNP